MPNQGARTVPEHPHPNRRPSRCAMPRRHVSDCRYIGACRYVGIVVAAARAPCGRRALRSAHRPTPIDEYATANAAQFAITRATLQEARSAAGGKSPKVKCCRSEAPAESGRECRAFSSESVASTEENAHRAGFTNNPSAAVAPIIRDFAGRESDSGDCQIRMILARRRVWSGARRDGGRLGTVPRRSHISGHPPSGCKCGAGPGGCVRGGWCRATPTGSSADSTKQRRLGSSRLP